MQTVVTIVTTCQRSCGKVMFSQAWCVFVCIQGKVPIWPLPMMHWTLLYSPLVPPPDMRPENPTPQPCPLLVASVSHHWRPFQICSLDLTVQGPAPPPPLPRPQEQHLVAIEVVTVSASEWYASYWNAFLLVNVVVFSPIFGIDFQIFYYLLMADTMNELVEFFHNSRLIRRIQQN